jgi:hypothetical protein
LSQFVTIAFAAIWSDHGREIGFVIVTLSSNVRHCGATARNNFQQECTIAILCCFLQYVHRAIERDKNMQKRPLEIGGIGECPAVVDVRDLLVRTISGGAAVYDESA